MFNLNIKNTVNNVLGLFGNNWKTPPEGRYMSIKEITSLSVGGIGVKLIVHCINQMIIATNNTLLGNTIGIDASSLYIIYIISMLASFPLTGLRAKMIDNTRSMKGKYRPYIISMGIPTVMIGIFMIMLPYESMSLFQKCFWVLLCNIGFQFFFNFMNDAYDSLINVLSPNSIERSDVLSVRCVVENLSPSIANIFFPLVAKMITGEDTLYDLSVYRILFPPLLFVGFLISIIAYVNTEEKIVRPKKHIVQVRFSDAFRAVAANKYFWIISLAGWLGFLENSFSSIMGWMYHYQSACSAGQYAVITAIAGNASFWPNLVAPFFIRKYGKKKIIIFSNILNIGLIAIMLPVVRMTGTPHIIWMLLFCSFINQFITSLGHLLTPSINADIRDYQQYISGERIDGMFAAVGLIGNVISMVTSGVLPVIYDKVGLNRETAISLGYDPNNVYDVLFNNDYFVNICSVLIIASVIGAVMNVIPMFFFDLTETKQKAMVRVLKLRAAFEDKDTDSLTEKTLGEVIKIINDAKNNCGKYFSDAKTREARTENEEIEIAEIIMDELRRYDTKQGRFEIALSEKIVNAGLNGYFTAEIITRKDIRNLPKSTDEEKTVRKYAKKILRDINYAAKAARKYFPDGVEIFDDSILEKLYKEEYEAEVALQNALKAMKNARETSMDISVHTNAVGECRKRSREIKDSIKKANRQNAVYYSAAKPWLDAKKTLRQKENYENYEAILN